jgi:hypothetical protein
MPSKKMRKPECYSVEFKFRKTPFTDETDRVYVFGKELSKNVKKTMLELTPFPEVIILFILEHSHPCPKTFLRNSHIHKALGIKNGKQKNSALRVTKHDVNAFINFNVLFSEGIQGYGIIESIKINALQIKNNHGSVFARTIEVKIKTLIESGYDGSISFKRLARLEPLKNWRMLGEDYTANKHFNLQ